MTLKPYSPPLAPVDNSTFNRVAQVSHFGWGLALVFGARVLLHDGDYWIVAALWTCYAAVKEFFWDVRFESEAIRGSSLEDFLFQVAGAGAAICAILLKG